MYDETGGLVTITVKKNRLHCAAGGMWPGALAPVWGKDSWLYNRFSRKVGRCTSKRCRDTTHY
jgi:hypothetical protein